MNSAILHTELPGDSARLADWLSATALADLSQGKIEDLSRRYDAAVAAPASPESEVIALLTRPFSRRLEIPEYYRYTWLHVVDWFLTRQTDLFMGSLLAAHTILQDLVTVERRHAGQTSDAPPPTAERIRRLRQVIDDIEGMPVRPGVSFAGAVPTSHPTGHQRQSLAVLAGCSGFRRSDKFDEHIFLRSVQACELVFFMIRWLARRAIPRMSDDLPATMFRMRQLAACAELLNTIFHALRTLTPDLFMGFRDATGDASAVQSLNYHLMELVVYGYDLRKTETYRAFPHLELINDPRLHQFRSLQDAARSGRHPEVAAAFAEVEQRLLSWRGRHYGFGRTYLPNMKGSGGTEGAGYLKRFVKKTGLPSGPRTEDLDQLLLRFALR